MKETILAINPGSTSTKIAVYSGKDLQFKETIRHDSETIQQFGSIIDQRNFRYKTIVNRLEKENFDFESLDAVVGRGGLLKPLKSGTYRVNDAMIEYIKEAPRGEHASNLGCVIAKEIADSCGIPSFIVDPVAVDEMEDIARYTGMPEIKRASLFHALNQKAVAYKAAQDLNRPYDTLNLIVAHLGGGISVGIHKNGRVVDVNNALDGDGPMSPERSGSVPLGPLYKMCFSGDYTLEEIKRKNYGNGGLVAYLGTNDGAEVEKRIQAGDEQAKFIYDVMIYQIAKEIGAGATVLEGDIDAIILTGGLAYDEYLVRELRRKTSFITHTMVYPGEDEMEALALGALRVIRGDEEAKTYE
ncbi:MAG: butyrate kinase [Bacillota bacterium]